METYSVKTVASIAMTNALDGKLLVSAPNNMLTLCLTIARKPVDVLHQVFFCIITAQLLASTSKTIIIKDKESSTKNEAQSS